MSATLDAMRSSIAGVARTWSEEVGVDIVSVDATFDEVVVRTAGVAAPDESGTLHALIATVTAEFGVEPRVVVTFEERQVVPQVATTTTTTATTTTTTTTVPEPVDEANAPAG